MLDLILYNTLTRKKEKLETKKQVNLYVCGITPYDLCHIGHARAYLVYDFFVRLLSHLNIDVQYVQNFTDIDDKILEAARERRTDFRSIAQDYIDAYFRDMDKLRIKRANHYPRVTEHIPEIIALIEKLVKKEYAYVVESGVYFSVRHFDNYGKLSGRQIDDLREGSRVAGEEDKREPHDFALWKKAKQGEPGWTSPFGYGRPGWHIECSALSMLYLGMPVDIHGGAIELAFPHHENEIAQSEAAEGKEPFVRLWLHCGLVTVDGQKMSKSLGNVITIQDALKKASVNAMRWILLSAHYRSPIDFSWNYLDGVEETLRKLSDMLDGKDCLISANGDNKVAMIMEEEQKFFAHLKDDLNTPKAIATLFQTLKSIRGKTISAETFTRLTAFLKKVNHLFGLDFSHPLDEATVSKIRDIASQYDVKETEINQTIQALLLLRKRWRENKEFERADALRKELEEVGILIEDAMHEAYWRFKPKPGK